jgi:hypothetical protein
MTDKMTDTMTDKMTDKMTENEQEISFMTVNDRYHQSSFAVHEWLLNEIFPLT